MRTLGIPLAAAAVAATLVVRAAVADANTPPARVAPDVAGRLQIGTSPAAVRPIERELSVVGTVSFDEDRIAVVGPRLAGRVVRLTVRPGDPVKKGDVLAEIESVELARAGADYLGAVARARAAEANARRERELAARNVSAARDREAAEAEAEALGAQADAAEQLLLALGVAREELPKRGGDRPLSRYALRSPIDGVVVQRDAEPGEAVDGGRAIFRIADLSHVRVVLDVFERDLAWVKPGLVAEIATEAYKELKPRATVLRIDPQIDRETRTAKVYLDVDNPGALLLPGKFVTARLKANGAAGGNGASGPGSVVVPRVALQSIDGRTVPFVKLPDGSFEAREVALGATGSHDVEVAAGVAAGEEVATANAFLLKSEVMR